MSLHAMLGFIAGLIFAGGAFYALTNYRLGKCETRDEKFEKTISEIKDNHLRHIGQDIAVIKEQIKLMLEKMGI